MHENERPLEAGRISDEGPTKTKIKDEANPSPSAVSGPARIPKRPLTLDEHRQTADLINGVVHDLNEGSYAHGPYKPGRFVKRAPVRKILAGARSHSTDLRSALIGMWFQAGGGDVGETPYYAEATVAKAPDLIRELLVVLERHRIPPKILKLAQKLAEEIRRLPGALELSEREFLRRIERRPRGREEGPT